MSCHKLAIPLGNIKSDQNYSPEICNNCIQDWSSENSNPDNGLCSKVIKYNLLFSFIKIITIRKSAEVTLWLPFGILELKIKIFDNYTKIQNIQFK